jgi:hypothetical protein
MYYTISRAFIGIPGIMYRAVFPRPYAANPQKTPTMLIARTGLAYAVTCSSFPRRPIALLNAFIIPSYIISLLRNVPVKIAPSLIGKRTFRRSRASGFSSSNTAANYAMIFSNRFLSISPTKQFAHTSQYTNLGGNLLLLLVLSAFWPSGYCPHHHDHIEYTSI